MVALSTYTPIATTTLSSTETSTTFSGITSAYKDLVIVVNAKGASDADFSIRFNSDTSSLYSKTCLEGDGTSASSVRSSSGNLIQLDNNVIITGANFIFNSIINISDYANTTAFKTVLARLNHASRGTGVTLGSYRSTSAITSVTLIASNSGFASGSTFSLYGIANNISGAKATGGTISSDSEYFYHSFYATDTFTPTQSLTCDYLVVAGGGAGGGSYGGGGGAGGFRTSADSSTLSVAAQAYTITVGAGGAPNNTGSFNGVAGSGTNSTFSTITSTGGGGCGATGNAGLTGGSGGGSAQNAAGGAASPVTSPVQGFAGGSSQGASLYATGGGGGAGAVGANGSGAQSGAGGVGRASTLNLARISTFYAGGGGGGGYVQGGSLPAAGGNGGGGNGGVNSGTGNPGSDGQRNSGGGGGGATYVSANAKGGAGGSGVVIIRYAR